MNEGPPASSSQHSSSESNSIDVAIETYRQMPVLSQDADPLRFWETNSAATVLQPLLPLAASVAAVPATEAICERLFKTGGQILTRGRLLGFQGGVYHDYQFQFAALRRSWRLLLFPVNEPD